MSLSLISCDCYILLKESMKFKVILEPEPEGGYTVICPDVKGAVSYGETVEEALEMIKDAIEGILEVRGELEKYAPPP